MSKQENTLAFYNNNAQSFVEQTINADMHQLYKPFLENIPNSSPNHQKILDLGCGSGRDSIYFGSLGFQVTAIDNSEVLIDIAKTNTLSYPKNQNNVDWHCATFENIVKQDWQKRFTAIWACASLLHVPYDELPILIEKLLYMLSDDGVFYASFKYGNSEHSKNGRFFCDMNEDRWQALKQKLSHSVHDNIWLTHDLRADRDEKWFNIIVKM